MSFRDIVIQDGPNRFVLPKTKTMKVEGVAFLSPELFERTDEALWRQVFTSASYDGVTGVYLMPDTHLGYGIPIGGVVVTDGTIIQSGSGYDISCGVVYLKVPGIHASAIADPATRRRWIAEVELRIATGVGAAPTDMMKGVSHRAMQEILRHGAAALGVSEDVCERQYIPVDEEHFNNKDALHSKQIRKAMSKAVPQLGSVGGGNHFVEMQVDQATGEVWVMVHCGSRGYGWNVADYFFRAGAELRGLPMNRREQSWLHADEPLGKEYWAWHNSAANFAVANRHIIVKGVQAATQIIYGQKAEVFYEISHNLVQEETLQLPDGTWAKGFVHRKGATRAMPAGHPDLRRTKWAKTGHPCLIPGSMMDGAAILYPLDGAYQTGCSVNHGSGRHMGRGAAKREFRELQGMIDDEMADITRTLGGVEVTGIMSNHPKIPLDECAHVYKDLDQVLAVLTANGIARIEARLYPVANIKGIDG
jgi:tRNA-splicing ligase RtcB (3'-phosphate/5'-hydroxy nucleic acid ligase)